jgi:hypothetical protein
MCAKLNNDRKAIAQELDVQFEGSSNNIIEYEVINKIEEKYVQEPIEKIWKDNNLWIWEEPIEGHEYICGVDVSTAYSEDHSVISIIDLKTFNQVLEYRGQIKQEELAKIVKKYCERYNALTVIDSTGGYADILIHELKKAKFKLFYYRDKEKDIVGFKIQNHRPSVIQKYVTMVENFDLTIRSIRQVNEMKTFILKNGRPDHQNGFNDDTIMATAMPLWIYESAFQEIKKVSETHSRIVNFWTDSFRAQREDKPEKIYKSQLDPKGEHSWVLPYKL